MQSQLRNEVLQWALKHKITELVQTFDDNDIEDPFLKVRALDLSYKSIHTIPSFFSSFTELVILDISHNQLTIIPQIILQLPKLQYINLNWNPLSIIPQFPEGVVVKNIYCRG